MMKMTSGPKTLQNPRPDGENFAKKYTWMKMAGSWNYPRPADGKFALQSARSDRKLELSASRRQDVCTNSRPDDAKFEIETYTRLSRDAR
jgi:hypothetical protein